MSGGVTQVSEHVFEIGGMGAAVEAPPVRFQVPPPLVAQPAAPARAAVSAAAKPLTASQMLVQLKARLREVNREITARQKLELERDQLQRLIRAATTERDNVRRLRAAG